MFVSFRVFIEQIEALLKAGLLRPIESDRSSFLGPSNASYVACFADVDRQVVKG